jgi:hypothetical protein
VIVIDDSSLDISAEIKQLEALWSTIFVL